MCFLYDLISHGIRSRGGPRKSGLFSFFFLISSPPPCLCFLSDATSHPTPTVTFTAGGRKRLSVCFSSAVKIRRLDSSTEGNGEKKERKTGRPGVFPTSKRRLDLTARPNKAPGALGCKRHRSQSTWRPRLMHTDTDNLPPSVFIEEVQVWIWLALRNVDNMWFAVKLIPGSKRQD